MKTGLFYGTGTEKTTFVANKIRKAFGEDQIDIIPIESAWKRDFEAYDHIIAGTLLGSMANFPPIGTRSSRNWSL